MNWGIFLTLCLFISIYLVSDAAVSDEQIDITEPCRYPVAVGIEKEFIPPSNMWATTWTNNARAASYGRLHGWKGGGAWTAGTPNSLQHIGVDLGSRHVVSGVASQGRRGSDEYATEFFVEFSSDNKTWNIYTNQYGTPFMFQANKDDNTVVRNNFQYPIVARYVRINPQRWHQFISMRIEIYGCRFDGEGATFDSQSRITYDISGQSQYVQTRMDYINLRFRTNQADGLLLYADGNQGDFIALEMVRGRLYFHIDLGSTPSSSGETSLKAGSLLDDNQWHDVEFKRDGRQVNFTVDRLTITNLTNGDFYQLDLDRHIHLGGLDNFLIPGNRIQSRKNFTGCMENVWFNYMNMIKDARLEQPRFQLHGAVMLGFCQVDPVVPYTFPTVDAHLKLNSPIATRFRIGLDFRTYNPDGLLFTHDLNQGGKVMMKLDSEGYLLYSLKTVNAPEVTNIMSNRDTMGEGSGLFNDGLWHIIIVDIESGTADRIGKVNFTVDGRPDYSERQLTFTTTIDYFIGGGDDNGGETGFIGCMRNIEIGAERLGDIPQEANFGVINGSCSIQDRCDPNPCEHGGICSQKYNTFECDCGNTGYEGAVCHKSRYLISCEEARMLNPTLPNKEVWVDIDDSGPLEPFPVKCEFLHDTEQAITEVRHQSMDPVKVDGYQQPGSYVRPIIYDTNKEEFEELIGRAESCEQNIKYRCYQSKLLSNPGSGDINIPSWGWWVGRTNLNMRYWGGSSPGSGKCACALKNECRTSGNTVSLNPCNCDAGLAEEDIYDDGYLRHKEHLPVMELRFGDTGSIGDTRWGEHTLGPLRCYGDGIFENTVTFRKLDATINFPTFDAATSGDIRFQFKTTVPDGIFLMNTGTYDFIELKLFFGHSIHFRFDVGNGIQTLEKTTAYPLNDDQWHTIHIERNRKQAMLKVDQQAAVTLEEPTDQGFRALNLNSKLVVGASIDYKDGFVGCMRGLLVNGVVMDMRGMVERGEVTYGVSAGCHPKCASNPCYNDGICLEWYSHYTCDCAYTPYRGWDCGREVGANMQPDYMVRFAFDEASGDISTDEETIIIGFSTQEKKGLLMLIRNDDTVKPEYISVEMNNNGGVKVALDVGFERDELNTDIQNVDLANGQQHVAYIRRLNKGRTLRIAVDDYPVAEKKWDLPDSTDTRLDKPKFMYFGRNETTMPGEGFKGCLFRAQFDNVYPLKRVFQDPQPDYIYTEPEGKVREDMCGFEEVTHAPPQSEFRPTPPINPNATTPPWQTWETKMEPSQQILLGGGIREDMCGFEEITQRPEPTEYRFVFEAKKPLPVPEVSPRTSYLVLVAVVISLSILLLVGLAVFIGRYFTTNKGDYKTYEAKDSQYYDNPDFAVASASTGQPDVQKKKEWFI